jgi:hypothetical protein
MLDSILTPDRATPKLQTKGRVLQPNYEVKCVLKPWEWPSFYSQSESVEWRRFGHETWPAGHVGGRAATLGGQPTQSWVLERPPVL